MKQDAPALGRRLAIAAACLFGTNGVIAHWFGEGDGKTPTMLAFRFIVGGSVFAVVAMANRPARPSAPTAAGATLTGLGHVAFTACLLYGFAKSSVALIVLLFYTYPLFVAIGSVLIHGERLTRARAAVILLGTAGVALAVGTPSGITTGGILLGLGAGLGNALVILGNQALLAHGGQVMQIGAISYLLPGAVFLVLTAAGVTPLPHTTLAWTTVLFYGTLGTMLPFWLFYTAVTHVGAPAASLFATLEPLVAVLLAWSLIDEPLALGQIAGGALILAAVALLSLQEIGGVHTPEAEISPS